MIEAEQHRQPLLPAPPALAAIRIRQPVMSGMECQECDSDIACLDMQLKCRDLTDRISIT